MTNKSAAFLPIGIGMGLSIGVALGVALDNVGLGLALGTAMGFANGWLVAKVKLPAPEAARLDELGLHVGSSVRVLSGAVNESILIAVGDSRIGVNFDVAQKIYVY